jgi:hypothetical protein
MQFPNRTLLDKTVFCGVVQRIFFRGAGPMGKKLTGDIAGIAPCS